MGNFFVIPPTGREISYQASVHIHRIGNDGKIVEHRAIRDDLTFTATGLVGPTLKNMNRYSKFLKGLKYSHVSHRQTTKSSPENESAICSVFPND